MPTVPTRAGDVSYRIQGKGVPIIMLHATLHSSHDFDTIASRLAGSYQTIQIDWPWHGESKRLDPSQSPSAILFADTLEDFLAELKIPPAIFIGNSVGGFAASRLAINHPEQVLGLILVNSGGFVSWNLISRLSCHALGSPFISRYIMPYLIRKYMSPQTNDDEIIMSETVSRARTTDGARISAALFKSFLDDAYDLRSRATEIHTPTMLVWGSRDPLFPRKEGESTQKLIPGSRLEFLDAGHVVFSSKPNEFLEIVRPFIESIVEGKSQIGPSS